MSINTKIIQVRLTRTVDQARRKELVTWVDNKPNLKVGVKVTLKGDDAVWTVAEVYPGEHLFNEFAWHNNWDNNI